jgi:hypothetical protein
MRIGETKAVLGAPQLLLKQHGTTNPNDIAAIGYCWAEMTKFLETLYPPG